MSGEPAKHLDWLPFFKPLFLLSGYFGLYLIQITSPALTFCMVPSYFLTHLYSKSTPLCTSVHFCDFLLGLLTILIYGVKLS